MGRNLIEYKREIEKSRLEILEIFQKFYPGNDTRRIEKAMDYAELLHRGQLRRNGVPYIFHPLTVAGLVAQAQLDESSIISALLHDTIEDTVASKQAIVNKFNPYIAEIVQALTKIRSYSSERSKEDDKVLTYKRILKAASKDIRPLLIKIYDRLANMRDMGHMPEGHRRRVSKETLDIYVPFTRRLGMYLVERELTDLSVRYMYPDEYLEIETRIDGERPQRYADLQEAGELIRKVCSDNKIQIDVLINWPIVADFYEEEHGLNLKRDVEAIAVLLIDELIDIYSTLGIVHSLYTPVPMAIRDKIASPMANGHRALETRMVINGRIHRFLLSTKEMNYVNNRGIIHNWRVNQSRLSGYYTNYMNLLEELLADEDIRVDQVLYQSHVEGVAVFSPRKDLYILPERATVLDFAYEVHHQVGEKAKSALINGVECGIDQLLVTGDVVQVITHPDVHPEQGWLDLAITPKALNAIKSYLKKQVESRAIELGCDMLHEEFEKFGLDPNTVVSSDDFKRILGQERLTLPKLYRNIGYRKIMAVDFIARHGIVSKERVANRKKAERASIREKIFSSLRSSRDPKWRFAKDDIFLKYAQCCNPIFGDKVVGIVSEGKGVTVHHHACSNLKGADRERLVEVEWDMGDDITSAVLNLHLSDRQGVLANVFTAVKKYGINMSEFSAYTINREAFMKIRLEVKNQRELLKVVNEIRKIDAVQTITRE